MVPKGVVSWSQRWGGHTLNDSGIPGGVLEMGRVQANCMVTY